MDENHKKKNTAPRTLWAAAVLSALVLGSGTASANVASAGRTLHAESLQQQQNRITGSVRDANGEPVLVQAW